MRRRGLGRAARRPSLMGSVARTAIIAGTASTVIDKSGRRTAERADTASKAQAFDDAQRRSELDAAAQHAVATHQAAAPAAPAAPAAAGGTGVVEQLQQLAALKDQGVLTDAEFSAAKLQLLG